MTPEYPRSPEAHLTPPATAESHGFQALKQGLFLRGSGVLFDLQEHQQPLRLEPSSGLGSLNDGLDLPLVTVFSLFVFGYAIGNAIARIHRARRELGGYRMRVRR